MANMKRIKLSAYKVERIECVCFMLLCCALLFVPIRNVIRYDMYEISEWLINYQGDFVRRGFMGEILFQLYQMHPYDVRYLIVVFTIVSFLIFASLVYVVFKKNRWSFIPVLFPLACNVTNLLGYRRDFLVLLLCAAIFYMMLEYICTRKKKLLLLTVSVMTISILIYEPSFFVFFPISTIMLWSVYDGHFLIKIVKVACVMALPAGCMLAVCICSGTNEIAEKIWMSWNDLIVSYPDGYNVDSIGQGVAFLGKDVKDVFLFHLDRNFGIQSWPSIESLLNNVAWLLMMIGVYYLVTFVPIIVDEPQELKPNSQMELLGGIFIFQWLMMLPMLTILSCDFGRVLMYCIFSTFFLVHISSKRERFLQLPLPIVRLNKVLVKRLRFSKCLSSPGIYLLIVLLIPYRSVFSPCLYDNVVVHMVDKINSFYTTNF